MNNILMLEGTECPKCEARIIPKATFEINQLAGVLDIEVICNNDDCQEDYVLALNIADLFMNSGQLQPMTTFPEKE